MANRIEVDMIVKAITEGFSDVVDKLDDTGAAARRASDDVGEGGQAAGSGALKWTELSSAVGLARQAFDVVAGAARQAYGVLKEAAGLEQAEQRFDRLANSIGTTSSTLQNQLSDAVRGMMTDAEAMALAGDLMSLGLAKSADETVRLTRVASALGMEMNQLTLTLANQSTMRFDSLGVSVDGFSERLESLEAQGLSTNEAFTEAFLQQAEEQILKVGDAADSTAGKLEILENRAKDAADAYKLRFLSALEPTIDRMIDNIEATDLLVEAHGRGVIATDEYRNSLEMLRRAGAENMQTELERIETLTRATDEAWAAATAEDALRRAMSDGQVTRQEYLEQMVELTEVHKDVARQQEAGERAADDFSEALDRLRRGEGEGILLDFTVDTEPARTELEDLITDYSGRQIPIEVLPTLRGRGDEQAQGEEILRPVKEALGGMFDEAVLQLQPQIDMQNMIDMEESMGNIITNSEYISTTPIEPQVHDTDVQQLLTDLGMGQDALDGIVAGGPYNVETESNVPEFNAELGTTLGLIEAIAGTHHVNIVTTHSGNPHTGPYDMGGAGGNGGGGRGGGNGGPGGPSPQFAPSNPIQILQDRGILSPGLLR